MSVYVIIRMLLLATITLGMLPGGMVYADSFDKSSSSLLEQSSASSKGLLVPEKKSLFGQISGSLRAVSRSHSTSNRLRDLSKKVIEARRLGSLGNQILIRPQNHEDITVKQLGLELRSSFQEQFLNQSVFLKELSMGLSLDFDLASIFGTSDVNEKSGNSSLRYGLTAKSIEPAAKKRLSASRFSHPSDLQNAPKAKVEWGIGLISSDYNRARSQPVSKPSGFSYPSTKIKGKIAPAMSRAAVPMHTSAAVQTGFKASLVQEQNFFRLEYHSSPAEKGDNLRQGIAVPLQNNILIDREMDKTFKVRRTSLLNLLDSSEGNTALKLNLHHLNGNDTVGDLYQSELSLGQGSSHFSFKATAAARNSGEDDRFEFGVSSSF